MPRKKVERQLITIDRNTLDDTIFNGVQSMIDDAGLPISHRAKLRIADQITTGVMTLVDAESVTVRAAKKGNSMKPLGPKQQPLPATSGMEPAPHKGT